MASILFTALALNAHECMEGGRDAAANLRPGQIVLRNLATAPSLQYFLYVPCRQVNVTPVFVSVHGISRNAAEHAQYFAPFAERYGAMLVAPLFSRQRFADYQRLGSAEARADTALDAILEEVQRLTGRRTEQFYLFGYSGGGQFGHRYALVHPQRVLRLALGAPGWYTFPDPKVRYPRGIKPSRELPGARFALQQFLKIPTCVLVGEKDVDQDDSLRDSERLNAQQGGTRLERARRWIAAMQSVAHQTHVDASYTLQVLPHCDHSFLACMKKGQMGQRVFTFFFPPGAFQE